MKGTQSAHRTSAGWDETSYRLTSAGKSAFFQADEDVLFQQGIKQLLKANDCHEHTPDDAFQAHLNYF